MPDGRGRNGVRHPHAAKAVGGPERTAPGRNRRSVWLVATDALGRDAGPLQGGGLQSDTPYGIPTPWRAYDGRRDKPPDQIHLPGANADCDGDVDAVDALFVLQHVAGLRPVLCATS